jgi:hypothetical protein
LRIILKLFTQLKNLQTWDPSLVLNPHMVNLMLLITKPRAQRSAQQWATAVADDDIDITQRYGENGFYLQHYTTQGKACWASRETKQRLLQQQTNI